MSFRKRNVALNQGGGISPSSGPQQSLPGVRPSPVTPQPTTSTGTASLDKLLGLGAGLALGTGILIEEDGTTDFASSLLRCAAAEGLCQGQRVFVIAPDGWSHGLPGVVAEKESGPREYQRDHGGEMKIAWRYGRLGSHKDLKIENDPSKHMPATEHLQPFTHTFDLTKRFVLTPGATPVAHIQPSANPNVSPFAPIISTLKAHLQSSSGNPTRLIIPTLLNPLLYPPQASTPDNLIPFLHTLRAFLRRFPTLIIITSWPLALYPRTDILTRLAETLADGVITLQPFPHAYSADSPDPGSFDSSIRHRDEEKMQGLVRVWKLPILSERGVSVGSGEDMAFAVGRRRFLIRPFHLPPLDGEEPAHEGEQRANLEF